MSNFYCHVTTYAQHSTEEVPPILSKLTSTLSIAARRVATRQATRLTRSGSPSHGRPKRAASRATPSSNVNFHDDHHRRVPIVGVGKGGDNLQRVSEAPLPTIPAQDCAPAQVLDTFHSCAGNVLPPKLFMKEVSDDLGSKRYSEFFDPCQEAANRSLKCLHRNGGERDMCSDYFQ